MASNPLGINAAKLRILKFQAMADASLLRMCDAHDNGNDDEVKLQLRVIQRLRRMAHLPRLNVN